MVKITDYSGYGICSLCGAEKPSKQIQYTSATRKASVPICDKCFKELKPCEGKKKKSKKSAETISVDELKGFAQETTCLEAFGQSMLGVGTVDLPTIVQIPDKKVSKEIEEIHDELLTITEEYND